MPLPVVPFVPQACMPWTERYRPQTLCEVVGNGKAKEQLIKWARAKVHKDAVMLVGPVGVGKTSLAHALCNDMKWVALDCQALPGEVLPIMEAALFRKEPLNTALILDEVDTWTAGDRTELVRLLKHPKRNGMPVLCIAEELGRNIDTIKRACTVIKMTRTDMRDAFGAVVRRLRTVTNASWPPRLVQQIEQRCCLDLRRAVVMLEMAALSATAACTHEADMFVDSLFDAAECILSGHPKQLSGAGNQVLFDQHDLMSFMLHENAYKRHDVMELAEWFSDVDRIDSHPSHTLHSYQGALSGHLFASLEPPFLRVPRLDFPAALSTMSRRRGFLNVLQAHRVSYDDWFILAPIAAAELAQKGKLPVFFNHWCAQQQFGNKDFRKVVQTHGALSDLLGASAPR